MRLDDVALMGNTLLASSSDTLDSRNEGSICILMTWRALREGLRGGIPGDDVRDARRRLHRGHARG